jgi:hypothetical protein
VNPCNALVSNPNYHKPKLFPVPLLFQKSFVLSEWKTGHIINLTIVRRIPSILELMNEKFSANGAEAYVKSNGACGATVANTLHAVPT